MPTQPVRSPRFPWAVPAVVIALAAVLIAVVVATSRDDQSTPGAPSPGAGSQAPAETQQRQQADLRTAETRDENDLLAVGPVDAPVALIVFSDYQCPFCARWNAETLPSMMEHVAAADLRIEWRDINVFGPVSERAARATYAAALQGAFAEYHDGLFADGKHRPASGLSSEALVALAGELGLDTDRFTTDLDSEVTTTQIALNQQLGLDLGVTSTPVFILGGQPIVGAQPTQVFEDAFQAALTAAG